MQTDLQEILDELRHSDPARRKQAVIMLGRQKERGALPRLAEIAAHDPVPEIRELAGKAINRIQQADAAHGLYDPLGIDQAEGLFGRALQLYKERKLKEAASPLAKAFLLDAALHTDAAARQMAASITGLEQDAAVRALMDSERFGQTPPLIRRERWGTRRQQHSLVKVGFFVAMVGMMLAIFINSGSFQYYRDSLQSGQWRQGLYTDAEYDYYALPPDGEPPITGWPVLVALPSYGAPAEALLPYFADRARDAGVLLVVPNFGEYPYPYSTYTTPVLRDIITRVEARFRVDSRGIVLFGFVSGGEIAMLYAQEYFGVLAVSAASAVQLHPPAEGDSSVRYLLTFTQADDLIEYNERVANSFRENGNIIDFRVLPGVRDILDEQQVAMTMELIQIVYGSR